MQNQHADSGTARIGCHLLTSATGYKASLSYRRVDFSTEGEYVFDTGESSDSFFYTWSELSFAPVDQFRVGVVIQRLGGRQLSTTKVLLSARRSTV